MSMIAQIRFVIKSDSVLEECLRLLDLDFVVKARDEMGQIREAEIPYPTDFEFPPDTGVLYSVTRSSDGTLALDHGRKEDVHKNDWPKLNALRYSILQGCASIETARALQEQGYTILRQENVAGTVVIEAAIA